MLSLDFTALPMPGVGSFFSNITLDTIIDHCRSREATKSRGVCCQVQVRISMVRRARAALVDSNAFGFNGTPLNSRS